MALSPEQLEKLKSQLAARKGIEVQSSSGGFLEGVRSSFAERTENQQEALGKSIDGEQGLASGLLQAAGQGAAFLGDVGFEAAKAITPEPVQELVGSAVETVAQTQPVQDIAERYEAWKTLNPEAAANLEAAVNIGSILPGTAAGVKTTQVGGKAVGTAAKTGTRAAKEAVEAVGEKVTNAITPMEKGVETVLRNTEIPKGDMRAKFERYASQAEQAVRDYSQPTPLELAGNEAASALKTLQTKLKEAGTAKTAALGENASKAVSNIGSFRAALRDQLRERVGVNLVVKDGKLGIETAAGRASKIAFDKADNELVLNAYRALAKLGKSPTVQQVDDTIDSLQDLLFKRKQLGAVPVNGQVESVLKNITKQLNDGVKKVAGENYTKANAEYARLKGTFDKLNKALGEEGNKGASLMKQLFSPSGTAPRKLFETIKKETGIDLVQEATIAKFVMENIGDVRQASLLEQVLKGNVAPTTGVGLIGKAMDFIVDKATDPLGKAKTIIEKRPD